MKKWEYKLLIAFSDADDFVQMESLGDMSKDGWELVSVTTDNRKTKFYLKRELP